MANNNELAKIGLEVVNGRYVLKSTLLVTSLAAFFIGGFIGFTTANFSSQNKAAQTNQAANTQSNGVTNSGVSQAEHDAQLFRLEEEARKSPAQASVWVQLGNFHFDHKAPQKSIEAYEKALSLNPNTPDVLVDCGIMYREVGQFNKAIEYFDRACKIDPLHRNARFNKGIVLYNDLNKKAEGIQAWQELLRLVPDAKAPNGSSLADFIKEHPVN